MITSLTRSLVSSKQWYRSMLAGNDAFNPGAYELISTTLLSSSAASVTFDVTGLGSTYKHLQIRATASIAGSSNDNIDLTFNNDTGNNYSYHALYGTGGLVRAEAVAPYGKIPAVLPVVPLSGYPNQFTASVIDILDAFSSTNNTTVRTLTGRVYTDGPYVGLHSGAWFNTAAVTSVKLTGRSNNISAGSRFSIYGLKGA